MIILRQKEFNSKAQKLLMNKYLDKVGAEAGIKKYISRDYRTVLNDKFKEQARDAANRKASLVSSKVNASILNKTNHDYAGRSGMGLWDKNLVKKQLIESDRQWYDHEAPSNYGIRDVKEIIKRSRE